MAMLRSDGGGWWVVVVVVGTMQTLLSVVNEMHLRSFYGLCFPCAPQAFMGSFRPTRILPCGHKFCEKCLAQCRGQQKVLALPDRWCPISPECAECSVAVAVVPVVCDVEFRVKQIRRRFPNQVSPLDVEQWAQLGMAAVAQLGGLAPVLPSPMPEPATLPGALAQSPLSELSSAPPASLVLASPLLLEGWGPMTDQ